MPRPATYKTNELLDLISPVFRERGFADATMSALSEASGLSKASLYHHFPDGKPEMARKILGLEGQRLHRLVLTPLMHSSPAEGLKASLEGVLTFYVGEQPKCLMNSLLLGEGANLFRAEISVAVTAWADGLKEAYVRLSEDQREAAAWSHYAIERIQGALIVSKVQASRSPLETAVEELIGDIAAFQQ